MKNALLIIYEFGENVKSAPPVRPSFSKKESEKFQKALDKPIAV